jgi:nucleotide-binding universal stress UspA family protein
MKTIIVINDGSAEAEHAGILALNIAQKLNASMLIANLIQVGVRAVVKEYVLVAAGAETTIKAKGKQSLFKKLTGLDNPLYDLKTEINEIDASEFSVTEMAMLIIKNNVWMMVKGVRESHRPDDGASVINMQSVLNRVMCPLLLVPEKYNLKDFERIVYIADLRYCQLPVVRYLTQLAKPYHANVQIAHHSAKGLPDMEEKYSHTFFREVISSNVQYDNLMFNNIKEKNLLKVVDVMVNVMHTDLLVLINHLFHFEELVGSNIKPTLPEHIKIPLLVFPS